MELIAISYLIQSQFKHIDLIDVIYQHNRSLPGYYFCFCRKSFVSTLTNKISAAVSKMVGADEKTYYLYCMYSVEESRGNHLAAYAYFKNYFDRLSALSTIVQQVLHFLLCQRKTFLNSKSGCLQVFIIWKHWFLKIRGTILLRAK